MFVFTDNWIQEVKSRYESRPRHLRTWPYFIATTNEFENARQNIESWIGALPEQRRAEVIQRLRSKEQFWNTYNFKS